MSATTENGDDGDLTARTAGESLLEAPADVLPSDIARPPTPLTRHGHGWLTGTGVVLTVAALLVGIGLTVRGIVELAEGHAAIGAVTLLVGLVIAGTHWGWVHVAEATANGLDGRRVAAQDGARRRWLEQIAPFDRYEVTTSVAQDGSIALERVHHRPLAADDGRFTFAREVEVVERHPAETAAAVVAERAELLRRDAARRTEESRALHASADDSRRLDRLRADVDAEDREAGAAASRALSERINAHLRDPPLSE